MKLPVYGWLNTHRIIEPDCHYDADEEAREIANQEAQKAQIIDRQRAYRQAHNTAYERVFEEAYDESRRKVLADNLVHPMYGWVDHGDTEMIRKLPEKGWLKAHRIVQPRSHFAADEAAREIAEKDAQRARKKYRDLTYRQTYEPLYRWFFELAYDEMYREVLADNLAQDYGWVDHTEAVRWRERLPPWTKASQVKS